MLGQRTERSASRGSGIRTLLFIGLTTVFGVYLIVVNEFFSSIGQSPGQLEDKAVAPIEVEEPVETVMTTAPATSWPRYPYRKYVWIDVAIDDEYVGRVTAELYADKVPKTVENFRALTTGELGPEYSFKGSTCHRIISGFIVQCGDYTSGNGRGGKSIYGGKFDDEPNGLRLKHSKRYILQMANAGPNTNRSQFCFMLGPAPHLNGKHVVFGEVVEGFEVVDKMEAAGVKKDGIPLQHKVALIDGGEIV